jgi:transcriptional regulator with XRE-family HTH domain/tetratricopeptide (TPR) repeat protein
MAPTVNHAEDLGTVIRRTYREAGVRQEDLAAAVGVSQSTISDWVNGRSEPSVSQIVALDRACGQPNGYIMRQAGLLDETTVERELDHIGAPAHPTLRRAARVEPRPADRRGYRSVVERRFAALRQVLQPLTGRRPLVAADEDLALADYDARLGRRGAEGAGSSVALWHARYTEWAEALDWLRSRTDGQPERLATDDVAGLGDRQAFLGVEVCDGAGNPLLGLSRDREIAARTARGLQDAAIGGTNVPAHLWHGHLLHGRSTTQAAEQARAQGDPRRTFDRWTWRAGLGVPEVYPARLATDLRNLLRSLENSLDRPSETLPNEGLPPALITQRIVPFLGRQAELEVLGQEWAAVQRGGSRVVLVVGDPGMGKSQLIYEFVRSIHMSAAVLASRPSISRTRAHAEMAELVRQISNRGIRSSSPTSAMIDEGGLRALRRLLPDVFGTDDELAGSATVMADQTALYDAIGGLLRRASAREPVVVVIEDLHAATADSMRGVAALIEQRIPRLLILLTSRRREAGSDAVDDLTEIARSTGSLQAIRLGELTEADLMQLTQQTAVLPKAGDRSAFVAALYRRTGGHPFFVTSLLELIARSDDPRPSGQLDRSNVPTDIADHITRRFTQLAPGTQSVLRAAAVIGDDLDVALLARILDQSPDDIVRAAVELEGVGLIASVEEHPGRVRFAHELIRDAIYWPMPSLSRAQLHRAAALAIQPVYTPELVATYAHHCYEAAGTYPDMRAQSVEASVQAGRDSMARLAFSDAVDHYRRALEHATSDDERARVGAGLGDALWRFGDMVQARQELELAMLIARRLGTAELLAEIATTLSAVTDQSNLSDPIQRALYEEVLRLLPEDEVFWRVRLLAAIARETEARLAPQVLPRIVEQTLDLASQADDPATQAYGYYIQHDALLSDLDGARRAQAAAQMAEAAAAANDPYLLCVSHGHLLHGALEGLDRAAVDAAIKACDDTARRFRYPYARWQTALYRAGLALFQSPLTEAKAAIEHAYAVGQPLGYGEVELMYLIQSNFLYRELGQVEKNEAIVRDGAANYELMAWKAMLACGLCEAEDATRHAEATPLLEEFESLGLDQIPRDATYPLTLSFLAQAYAYRRDRRGAILLLPVLKACRRRHPVGPGTATYWGSMDYHLGLLHATVGEHDEAIACFETAMALDRNMDASLWNSHTLVAQAQVLRARAQAGDRLQASRLEAKARRLARRFGYKRIEQVLDGKRPAHLAASADPS